MSNTSDPIRFPPEDVNPSDVARSTPGAPHPIRFALVGAGQIGARHARQMARCGQLIAVADTAFEKALQTAEAFNATAYPSIQTLLDAERPDLLAVCTPNDLHAPQSILALRSGIHVLCEKPMCLTSLESGAMIAAARLSGRHLFVVKQNRFNPPVQLLHRLLREGRLGRVLSFQVNAFWHRPPAYYLNSDWHGKESRDGGVLFTQFSHFIDLLCWLLGKLDVTGVQRDNYLMKGLTDGEDTGIVTLKTADGAIGMIHYTVAAWSKNMEGSLTVLGEKGTVKIGGEYLNELDYFRVQGMEAPTLASSRPANEYGAYQGSMSNHDKVYDELVKALRRESFDLASAVEAGETVTLIEQIKSAGQFKSAAS
jgi:UDP-N-acetyl-2-amino-2-deoxyglucuronate dehydrogenase